MRVDGQWAQRVSVYSEEEVWRSPPGRKPLSCTVKVTTRPQVQGRTGNKVKVLALFVSARQMQQPGQKQLQKRPGQQQGH